MCSALSSEDAACTGSAYTTFCTFSQVLCCSDSSTVQHTTFEQLTEPAALLQGRTGHDQASQPTATPSSKALEHAVSGRRQGALPSQRQRVPARRGTSQPLGGPQTAALHSSDALDLCEEASQDCLASNHPSQPTRGSIAPAPAAALRLNMSSIAQALHNPHYPNQPAAPWMPQSSANSWLQHTQSQQVLVSDFHNLPAAVPSQFIDHTPANNTGVEHGGTALLSHHCESAGVVFPVSPRFSARLHQELAAH